MTDDAAPADWAFSYSVGANVTLLATGAALMFAETPTGAMVARCWPLVLARTGVAGIIDALIESGLDALPGFALVCADEAGASVVVRAPGQAVVTDRAGEPERLDAADLGTWSEQRLTDVAAVTIGFSTDLGRSAPEPPGAGVTPSVGGTVLAGSVTLRVVRPASAGVKLPAVACPYGHLGPPYEPYCRVCGTAIEDSRAFLAERPPLGLLRLSTGDVIPLDRGVIMGRNPRRSDDAVDADPQTARAQPAHAQPAHAQPGRPRLIRLPSPDNDVSRTHVEVRLEDWHVLVVDLGSTNGTTVTMPDHPPVRLRAHEPLALEPNAEVNLADEIVFRFEVPTQ